MAIMPKNFTIESGTASLEQLIHDCDDGVYVFENYDQFHALNLSLIHIQMCIRDRLRGYSNEEYDKLYDEAIASPTIEERKANYFEVEKFFCDNTLNLILGWADGGFQYKSGYTGFYNTCLLYTSQY